MSERPQPRITVDERGVLLHMTTSTGEAVCVELSPETVFRLLETLQRAALELKTPSGKQLLKSAALTLWHGLTNRREVDGKE
jgi:hypothetical protein